MRFRNLLAAFLVTTSALPAFGQIMHDPSSGPRCNTAATIFANQAGNATLSNAISLGTVQVFIGVTGSNNHGASVVDANGNQTIFVPPGSSDETIGAVATHEFTHNENGHTPPPKAGEDFENDAAAMAFWASECEAHASVAAALMARSNGTPPARPSCQLAKAVIRDGAKACALAEDLTPDLPVNPFGNSDLGELFKDIQLNGCGE